ncbi:MAG: TonB-dependent receptor plug [Elusimicrobia bacterium]|nr:MAG: TonB-dependent receptor plug [Elusimicrobiota bacterium]KAF0154755.1 MAG: TonB-dependent receptor plug [Elusimicrobiota bacterium]
MGLHVYHPAKRLLPFILTVFALAAPARAGTPAAEAEFFAAERHSLEEALNIKTSVASRSPMTLREAPGLVALITREEIQASGARNLVDVLGLVPEFGFGVDVQGNLGLGVRGNWANEGKVLLIWDGQHYNEILYATIQFDRFPVDQVEEIEIIRGPGSAVYGGFAGLAVINVRTRAARDLRGGEVYAAGGLGGSAARYAGWSFGKVFQSGEISAKAFAGRSRRSDGIYRDFTGGFYYMKEDSGLHPRSVNLHAVYGITSARLIIDDFSLEERDHFASIIATRTAIAFPALFAELKQSVELPGRLTLEPRFAYTRSKPWRENDAYFPYDKTATRLTLGLTAFYRHSSRADFLAGGEYYRDDVDIGAATGDASATDIRGVRLAGADYDNRAFFGQGTLDLGFALLTAGARYEKHSECGSALVPRLAATKQHGELNFKAIYSRAFKNPSIENIRLSTAITSEKVESLELETGYKASENIYVSANAFSTSVENPIIFSSVGGENYRNYGRTGTRGAGASFKYRRGDLRADLGYLYQEARRNRVASYAVSGRSSYLLAFPRHKLTLNSSIPLAEGLSLNPSGFYISKRYGYAGAGALSVFAGTAVANLNLQLKDRPLKRLTLNLGLRDIFNSGYSYIQPYDSGHAPLPGPARELFLKAAYEF